MNYQALLDRCPHTSTIGMGNDAWLYKRWEGIGESDAGAYSNPLTVYFQKEKPCPERGNKQSSAPRENH
jgi:hypothetical protein